MNDLQLPKTVWPVLNYDDAHAAIAFLVKAFGFKETAVHNDESGRVVHAELQWPEGGGVMLGDARRDDSVFPRMPTRCASVYVVTDEPDAVHARATASGAEVVSELRDEDYGSRGFSVRDPEHNIWSFGTYRGE